MGHLRSPVLILERGSQNAFLTEKEGVPGKINMFLCISGAVEKRVKRYIPNIFRKSVPKIYQAPGVRFTGTRTRIQKLLRLISIKKKIVGAVPTVNGPTGAKTDFLGLPVPGGSIQSLQISFFTLSTLPKEHVAENRLKIGTLESAVDITIWLWV